MLAVWYFNGLILVPKQLTNTITNIVLVLYVLPTLLSGYIGGRLAGKHGLLIGFTSNIVAILAMGFSFFPYIFDKGIYAVSMGILIATLAGGVGELNSLQAKNA